MEPPFQKRTYAGVFLLALATLTYEILLTRIFSVTMWYHFAFMAISIAMFGMTVGALIVYLRPRLFPPQCLQSRLALSSWLFAVAACALLMAMAAADHGGLTPWLWGVNGATSVCGSLLAVAIALSAGLSTTFWAGLLCYTVGFAAFLYRSRRQRFAS